MTKKLREAQVFPSVILFFCSFFCMLLGGDVECKLFKVFPTSLKSSELFLLFLTKK